MSEEPADRDLATRPRPAPDEPGGSHLDPHLVRALEGWGNGALREYLLRDGGLHLPHPPGWPSSWPGRTRLGAQMAYLLTGLPLAVVSGVVVLVGLVLGAGTFVIWIGLPITVGLLAAALWGAAQGLGTRALEMFVQRTGWSVFGH